MYKIKRFVNCTIPIHMCNLKCSYCYISQTDSFETRLENFKYDAEFMSKALSVSRLGGACQVNLCAGGETLLSDEVIDLAKYLLEDGHFVSLVTNGTLTNKIIKISEFPENLLEKVFIKFSFHYLELKRLGLFDVFFDNVKRIQNSKASFSIELTVNDECLPYIDDIKKLCIERLGVLCHVMEARDHVDSGIKRLTKLEVKEHQKIWGSFNSSIFEFQQTTWGVKRKEFCYAGDWTLHVHLGNGNLFQCFRGQLIQNIYEDISSPIKFAAVGNNCSLPHCYTSYAWLTIGGAIPSIKTPFYSELRNRVLSNGEEWLKSPVKEFFTSKPSERNEEYSLQKKEFVNALMSVLYNNGNKCTDENITKILIESFQKSGIKSVAIYGVGRVGKWLLSILEGSPIEIKYLIDTNYQNITESVRCISADDVCDDVDAIIVTPIKDYHSIREILNFNDKEKIVSVVNLV